MINRKYKDTIFRRIFNDKKELLELYNAVNNSHYENPDELEIVTLEDVIYMSIKNDLAFIIASELQLYEHQSTICPNMPLRGFLYFAREYQAIADKNKSALYSEKLVMLPMPQYIVFYNGEKKQPERQVLRLSDAFEMNQNNNLKTNDIRPCLECEAIVLNINPGYNENVKNACKNLRDYVILIEKIRENKRQEKSLEEAVDSAIEYCIQNGVLDVFLRKHRAEVYDMVLTQYDAEAHMEFERDYNYRKGVEDGRQKTIVSTIKLLRNMERSEEDIKSMLQEEFRLTEEELRKYFQE